MNWVKSRQRSAVICALTLLVPMILYFDALVGLWGMQSAYQSEIDRLNPRIARLQGLISNETLLRESSVRAGQEVQKLIYPAESDGTTISAALQTSARQIVVDAGLSVSNSQVLSVREEAGFEYIGIKLTVAGDIIGLDEALSSIAQYSPLLLVESMEVWPANKGRGEAQNQDLTATLRLLSLRAVL